MKAVYQRIFAINEIEQSKPLQLLFWCLWAGFLIAFFEYSYFGYGSIGHGTCWPHFQGCQALRFFAAPPYSYSLLGFYSLVFAVLTFSGWSALHARWVRAHASLLVLFAYKFILFFVLSYDIPANFEYFHLVPCALWLFARHKLYFAQRAFLLFYLFAAALKLNESWIVGSYFTSLKLGMPLVPNSLVPLFTHLVIALEAIGVWFLVSKSVQIRAVALRLFVLFHLYSIILVGFKYPVFTLFPLLVLFSFAAPVPRPKWSPSLWPGVAILALFLAVQTLPYFVAGDRHYTLEGYKWGISMFDANHQCRSQAVVRFKDGSEKRVDFKSRSAMNRCMVYYEWLRVSSACKAGGEAESAEWTYDHSINGGPFLRIVESDRACDLGYLAWRPNSWIKPPSQSQIVGYPYPNYRLDFFNTAKEPGIAESPQIHLNSTQEFLQRHVNSIALIWWILWAGGLAVRAFTGANRSQS